MKLAGRLGVLVRVLDLVIPRLAADFQLEQQAGDCAGRGFHEAIFGGQCAVLYPEKPIYDIPGFPEITAIDLIQKLSKQAAPFEPVFHLGQRLEKVARNRDDGWRVETTAGTRIYARAVVIAGGVGAFGPNRPPLEGLSDHDGKSVFHNVMRREDFTGKEVIIYRREPSRDTLKQAFA